MPKASSNRRSLREIANRLSTLSKAERDFLLSCADRSDQQALLWLATCRAYRFVREYALEVIQERYATYRLDLHPDTFDQLLAAKAEWDERARQRLAANVDEVLGIFEDAARNPFLLDRFKDLQRDLLQIADKDKAHKDRVQLEKAFMKSSGAGSVAGRVQEIGKRYRRHRTDSTYVADLDDLLVLVTEAAGAPEELPRLQGVAEELALSAAFHAPLWATLRQFEQAKNFGSLIVPKLRDPAETLRVVEARDFGGDLLLKEVQERVVAVLRMAEALSPKYHVVVANPPYAGAKGLNGTLGAWIKQNYPRSKSDLMTCFMERSSKLTLPSGFWGMINLPSWMFLGSFEQCRACLLDEHKIDTLLQLGRGIFGSDFGSVAFTIQKRKAKADDEGTYRRLFEQHVQVRKPSEIEALFLDPAFGRFKFAQNDFSKIPGQPIAFSLSKAVISDFANMPSLSEHVELKAGLLTGDNVQFQREWFEVSLCNSDYNCAASGESTARWFPCHSGGDFRKWYGNHEVVVNWQDDGAEIRNFKDGSGKLRSRPQNIQYFFREGITYSKISAGKFDSRYRPAGFVFDDTGRSGFASETAIEKSALAFLCSNVADSLLAVLCPTLSFNTAELNSLPFDANAITNSKI